MAQTPLTSTTSYLSVAQFLLYCDPRTVGDLVSNDGNRVTASALLSDTILAAILRSASGMLESAAMKGARYTPTDLAAIAASTSVAQGMMHLIIARLATGLLYERRPDKGPPPESYKLAQQQLEALMSGEMIFGTVETADAQVMEAVTETAQDVEDRNGTSFVARRFFGRRSNQESGL